jgi:hypothetical protein
MLRVQGSAFRAQGLERRVYALGFKIRVRRLGFGVFRF